MKEKSEFYSAAHIRLTSFCRLRLWKSDEWGQANEVGGIALLNRNQRFIRLT